MESHRFTASDGIGLHYLTAGTGGSWVVLLHGRTDSAERMWGSTGIADALAENHRVVALDLRNHGESDRPGPTLDGRAEDTIELMDHLGIDRAHVHAYSLGGRYVLDLLADSASAQRVITAGLGGSGLPERDAELRERAATLDPQPPTDMDAPLFSTPEGLAAAFGEDLDLDLDGIDVPILCINGQYDRPYSKSQRLWREARTFRNVILPGCDHLLACGFGSPLPAAYLTATIGFISGHDR